MRIALLEEQCFFPAFMGWIFFFSKMHILERTFIAYKRLNVGCDRSVTDSSLLEEQTSISAVFQFS